MKFSLVAALVLVLAIAHGSESVALVKRDAPSDLEKITKFLQDLSASFTSATQDMVEKVKAHELTNQAQTYIEDSKAQIQPLVEKVQAEAEKIQEQMRPYLTNIEEQMRPMADNLHAQIKPLADNFQAQIEQIFQQAVDQAKALLPPQ